MTEHAQVEPQSTPANTDDAALLAFVADRDAPCPSCGYNLRQISRARCPECGLSLTLSVGSNEPFRRAWSVALWLNAMTAGIGVVFLLLWGVVDDEPPGDHLTLLWFYGPMFWIPMPLVVYLGRRIFCKCPKAIQALACVLSAAWLVAIGLMMVVDLR